jgi:hypothetical protein
VLGQCSVLEQNAFPAPHTGCQIRHTAQRYADLAFGWIPRAALSANISETLLGPLIRACPIFCLFGLTVQLIGEPGRAAAGVGAWFGAAIPRKCLVRRPFGALRPLLQVDRGEVFLRSPRNLRRLGEVRFFASRAGL